MSARVALVAAALAGCSSNPLASMTPADRVKFSIEAVRESCGAYLGASGAREANLDEFCKAIVKPPAVEPEPLPSAAVNGGAGRVASAGSGS